MVGKTVALEPSGRAFLCKQRYSNYRFSKGGEMTAAGFWLVALSLLLEGYDARLPVWQAPTWTSIGSIVYGYGYGESCFPVILPLWFRRLSC